MLDSVEHGETIVVTRAGRRIAAIVPVSGVPRLRSTTISRHPSPTQMIT
jgi:prevent-host-death family protein